MIDKEIEGVLVMFTLTIGVRELGELQSETSDRDPCSSFVTESAWPTWGIPLLVTCLSVFFLSRSIDLGSPMVSPGGDPVLGFSKSCLGMRRAACVWRCFGFHAQSCDSGGPYPGHVSPCQATFRLTRRCFVSQCASPWPGHVPSFPIHIEWAQSFAL